MNKHLVCFMFALFTELLCSCSVDDVPEVDFKPIEHYVYNGAIRPYVWDEHIDGFNEIKGYKYGFDKNPYGQIYEELDKNVYITVSNKEDLSTYKLFVPVLSNGTYGIYNSYALKDVNSTVDSYIPIQDGIEVSLPAGRYQLYGVDMNGIYCPVDRFVEILAYQPKPKKIVYVELNGTGLSDIGYKDGYFNQVDVEQKFAEIYGQAVLEGDFITKTPEDLGLPSGINISVNMMVQEESKDDPFNIAYEHAANLINSGKREFLNTIIAVNKMEKYWPLRVIDDSYSFMLDERYDPADEPSNVQYYIRVSSECGGGSSQPVTLKEGVNSEGKKLYRAHGNDGKVVPINDCSVLFTENGYPVVTATPGAAAVNAAFTSGTLHMGGIAWVPYGKGGVGSYYTMMHELGHSFGLTDVEKNFNEENIPLYYESGLYSGYVVNAATSESNLMAWQQPTGVKLRYRGSQVVCTGGVDYYSGVGVGFVGSLERYIPELYDNQISCLQGDCEDLSVDGYWYDPLRLNYWDQLSPTSYCNETYLRVDHTSKDEYDVIVENYKAKKIERHILHD
ncbi:MAG: hypothetical protein J6W51_03475 [Fibrobacter sp.]|nr:hypothetical protein [Fibrobacter sp.]